ncbi:gamma-interferon-inducible lysosomal thiol reductase-like [Oppia nitens]|uniref:gamma-interferon-inducible lysosomal thiol reductase-like n=1 Tax=Oppia nitens TaxID=1686743 RepID=UPI0023DA4960|nr:gamma-interferon-inducible lysosomal thiol reductase-like [Oppia nitens]
MNPLISISTTLLAIVCCLCQTVMGADNYDDNQKVNIDVYYESLCPDCIGFINKQLVPTYPKLSNIMNVQLFPYGFTETKRVNHSDGTYDLEFDCQHGLRECIGNWIHSCVLDSQPINKSIEIIGCMSASKLSANPAAAAEECAKTHHFEWPAVKDCAASPLGRGLSMKVGQRFLALKPKPWFVHWIVLNGQHTEDIQKQSDSDLHKLVCDTYKGTKPTECN